MMLRRIKMSDIDSYLLKCALESIEQNISTQDIQERCECQMGFQQSHSDRNEKHVTYGNI